MLPSWHVVGLGGTPGWGHLAAVVEDLRRNQPVILPPGTRVEIIRPRCARVLHRSAVGDEFDELYFDEGGEGG